jgi:hypothetical protein
MGLLAVVVIESRMPSPWQSVDVGGAVPLGPRAAHAHGDGGHAQRTYQREADRERMERKIRRCKYLAEISRVASRDVLVEIMYERARLGCAGLGY